MATGPIARWFPHPGLLWRSGVPTAVSQAPGSWEQLLTRVRPWQEKHYLPEEQAHCVEYPSHLCDPTGTRAEERKTHNAAPYRRGGFHKAGEGPAFGGSLVTFCPAQKVTPAERPCQGRRFAPEPLAKSQSLNKKGGRTLFWLFHLSYCAYWLRPIWNRSLPWLSTATVRGRSSTSMRLTDSHPSSSKAMTWAVLMHLAMRAPAPPTAAK